MAAPAAAGESEIPACMLSFRTGPEHFLLILEKQTAELKVYSTYSSTPLLSVKVRTAGFVSHFAGELFLLRRAQNRDLKNSADYCHAPLVLQRLCSPNPKTLDPTKKKIILAGKLDSREPEPAAGSLLLKEADFYRILRYVIFNNTLLYVGERIPFSYPDALETRRHALNTALREWLNKQKKNMSFTPVPLNLQWTGDSYRAVSIFNLSDSAGGATQKQQIICWVRKNSWQPVQVRETLFRGTCDPEKHTIEVRPRPVWISSIRVNGQHVSLTVSQSAPARILRLIPVLVTKNSRGSSECSLPGIKLNRGVPADFSNALLFDRLSRRIAVPLPLNARLSSVTLFVADQSGRLNTIVTSLTDPHK